MLLCVHVSILTFLFVFFFHGALRPQKPYGLLGTGFFYLVYLFTFILYHIRLRLEGFLAFSLLIHVLVYISYYSNYAQHYSLGVQGKLTWLVFVSYI